jgi:hypothetical protein
MGPIRLFPSQAFVRPSLFCLVPTGRLDLIAPRLECDEIGIDLGRVQVVPSQNFSCSTVDQLQWVVWLPSQKMRGVRFVASRSTVWAVRHCLSCAPMEARLAYGTDMPRAVAGTLPGWSLPLC